MAPSLSSHSLLSLFEQVESRKWAGEDSSNDGKKSIFLYLLMFHDLRLTWMTGAAVVGKTGNAEGQATHFTC
jgi:hypothetical protein